MMLQRSSCNILVQSSNVDLGSVLPDYARAGVMQVASKYFGNLNIAAVHFNREGGAYRCTVNVQMGALPMMSGEADDRNAYAAFRRALEKVAKQLRRAKRELREDKPQRLDKGIFLYEPGEVGRRANRQSDGDAPALRHLLEDASGWMPLEVSSGDGAHRIAAQ
ncbi:HPF/RaiA family ribosome-associated protein [Methylorubrum extorquens]